jgi:hypothetical protein
MVPIFHWALQPTLLSRIGLFTVGDGICNLDLHAERWLLTS